MSEKTLTRRILESALITGVSTLVAAVIGSAFALIWTNAMSVNDTVKEATKEIIVTQEVYGQELDRQKKEDLNIVGKVEVSYDRTVENRDRISDSEKRVEALETLILNSSPLSMSMSLEVVPEKEHSLSEVETEAKKAISDFQTRQMAVPPVQEILKSYKTGK